MRGEKSVQILEFFAEGAKVMSATMLAMLISGRGTSHFKFKDNVNEILSAFDRVGDQARERQRWQNMIGHLRREGLVMAEERGGKQLISLTKKGEKELQRMKERIKHGFLPSIDYERISTPTLTIITFDISEKNRHKRNWLRSALKNLSFTMLQKSVWLGKVKIPERFMEDLKIMDLLPYVEILGITKQGTLKELKY